MAAYQEKEKLRYLTQSRRIANGLDYMVLQKDPVQKPEKVQITEEEELKRCQRREQNRIAASKSRRKRKERIENLQKEIAGLNATNRIAEDEIARLTLEKQQLLQALRNHRCAARFTSRD